MNGKAETPCCSPEPDTTRLREVALMAAAQRLSGLGAVSNREFSQGVRPPVRFGSHYHHDHPLGVLHLAETYLEWLELGRGSDFEEA